MSLMLLERLAPLEPWLRQRRKSVADEVGRAAESIALNVSEARQRAGLDRATSIARPDPAPHRRRRIVGRDVAACPRDAQRRGELACRAGSTAE
jgi:hypothetical protein